MSTPFSNRHEFLFIYEAVDCNPNGDPLDENRPRTDPETGVCTVTDVRIKRTIRDELLSWEPDLEARMASGREILIRDTWTDKGFLSQGKERADHFATPEVKKLKKGAKAQALQEVILNACIDARLFGTTLPVDKGSLKVTGAVQFMAFNRSLHAVSTRFVQQTAAFAGGANAHQKSFAERYVLPYALIAVYGVANEVAARTSTATDADLAAMTDALWRGTANLATSSKMGHAPLLLAHATYDSGRQLGMLQQRVALRCEKEDTTLRSTRDFELDLTDLITGLSSMGEALCAVRVRQDDRLSVRADAREGATAAALMRAAELPIEVSA